MAASLNSDCDLSVMSGLCCPLDTPRPQSLGESAAQCCWTARFFSCYVSLEWRAKEVSVAHCRWTAAWPLHLTASGFVQQQNGYGACPRLVVVRGLWRCEANHINCCWLTTALVCTSKNHYTKSKIYAIIWVRWDENVRLVFFFSFSKEKISWVHQ